MKTTKIFLIVVVGSLLVSCLRYVPSRKEIEQSRTAQGVKPAEFAGEEAFYSFDRQQQDRLKQLLGERNTASSANVGQTYRIGRDDLLEINVFEVEELNRKVRVSPAGFISLPLVGQIKVEGLTEADLQNELSTRLRKFVHNPQIQVFIADYGAHKVSVIGAVARPGIYPLKRSNYTLLEIISEAGGRSEAAASMVILIPANYHTPAAAAAPATPAPEQPSTPAAEAAADQAPAAAAGSQFRGKLAENNAGFGIEIYFDDLVGSLQKPPALIPLQDGDTIVVPDAGMVQVDGEVKAPGSYKLASKMTLLGAVAASGGLTYSADVNQVEVIRELGAGKKALLTVNLELIALREGTDIRLRDGDVVRVPSSPGRFATRQVIEGVNKFLSFGLSGSVSP